MSKRGADEYITKEHGSIPNQRDAEESKKMATAAQLARRKIAQPKSRMARNGPYTRPRYYNYPKTGPNTRDAGGGLATGTEAPATNPFSSMNNQSLPQQTFQPVNGFTFGAPPSQSFPQGSSTSHTGGLFNFSASAENNPFATTAPANNPFTNPSGNSSFTAGFGNSNGNTLSTFGGFGQQNGDDVSMDSPEKKQQTSSIFGNQSQQGPSASTFNFSASQAAGQKQAGGALFGSQNNQASQPNGAFGQAPEKKDEQPIEGLFGQRNTAFGASSSQKPLFGASQPSTTPSFNFTGSAQANNRSKPPLFSLGSGTETPSTSQDATSTPFKFGGATTATTQPSTPINSLGGCAPATAPAKSLFSFGDNQADKPARNIFGSPQPEELVEAKPTGFIFGRTTSSQPPADQAATTSKPAFSFGSAPVFGQPKSFEGKPAEKPNVWANVPKAPEPTTGEGSFRHPEKPTEEPKSAFSGINPLPEPPKAADPSNNLFGRISTPEPEPEKSAEELKNPFGDVFGAKPPTITTETEKPKSSLFSFPAAANPTGPPSLATGAPSQTSSTLFGNVPKASSHQSSLFSNPNKPTDSSKEAPALDEEENDAPTSGPPEKVSDIREFTESTSSLPDTLYPIGPSMIRFKPSPMKYIPTYSSQISENRRQELFGHIPKSTGPPNQFESKPNPHYQEPSEPKHSPSKGGLFSTTNPAALSSASSTEGSKKRLFESYRSDATPSQSIPPTPTANQAPLPTFGSSAAPGPPASKSTPAASTLKPVPTSQVSKKAVFAQPAASSIPLDLSSNDYREFDNQDKLRALNRDFRKKIMAVDVATHDIDTILRVYVAARNSIGADIGLYHRTVAGTKRKSDQPADPAMPSGYKKVRPEDPETTSTAQPASKLPQSGSATGPSFQPSASDQPASSNIFGNTPQGTKPSAPSPTQPVEQNKASQLLNNMIPKSPGKTPSQPQQSPEKPRNVFGGIQPLAGKSGPLFGSPAKRADSSSSSNPAFGQSNASTTPSKPSFGFMPSTTPAKSPPKAPGFAVSGSVGDGFSAFGKKAEIGSKKRRAELLEDEYSSSEESQAEGKRELAEKERQKKAKYESIPKTGFVPNFGAPPASASTLPPKKNNPFEEGSSGSDKADDEGTSEDVDNEQRDGSYEPEEDEEEESEDDGEEEGEEEEEGEAPQGGEDEEAVTDPSRELSPDQVAKEIAENPNKGRSIFDRISVPPGKVNEIPNGNHDTSAIMNSITKPGWKPAPVFAEIGKSTPEQPAFSPFTPASTPKPAATFNFTSNGTNTPVLGGATTTIPPKFEGLFGSRPSTPSHDRPANAMNSTPADHTWKQGSPIRFGTTTPDKANDAPRFSFTAASPSNKDDAADTPKAFGSLFGKPVPSSASKPDNNLGFSFGQSSTTPAPGFLSAAPHLGVAGSATSSAISSRASSPGLTDNESVATDFTDTEGPPPDVQAKYNESRAGEEDEETVYEVPTVKALRLTNDKTATPKDPKGSWVTMGQGPLRLLRNRAGKTRLLIRNSTNGNIILNEYLQPKLAWSVQNQANGKTGAVKGFLAQEGSLNQWVIKLKAGREGELTEALERERKAQETS